jgi:hypothetical protein
MDREGTQGAARAAQKHLHRCGISAPFSRMHMQTHTVVVAVPPTPMRPLLLARAWHSGEAVWPAAGAEGCKICEQQTERKVNTCLEAKLSNSTWYQRQVLTGVSQRGPEKAGLRQAHVPIVLFPLLHMEPWCMHTQGREALIERGLCSGGRVCAD